tara:strand:- start:1292 stop:2119 length:828 start_codon:yes stop_codon:yes gene_type:complete
MNIDKALNIMNITKDELYNIDPIQLKKIYHKQALKFHPDKGGTNEEFKNLQEAYDYLIIIIELNKTSQDREYDTNDIIHNFKHYIYTYVNNVSLSYIDECDEKQLNNLESILNHYKNKIPTSIYSKIYKLLKKNSNKEFILEPTINDLVNDKIYRFHYDNEIFNVPLWHSEMYYDTKNNVEICIKCIPKLPEFLDIDCDNNIHIFIKKNIKDIFVNQHIKFNLTDTKIITVDSKHISFLPYQEIIIPRSGISKINNSNIYNTSIKSNIILHLTLY